ncbi:nuclear transport factor 2 family protein [Pseudomonas fluorescens]|uniref:nuclear transport factor 2 family protein n=1 Tax=Pseudomonas fluorescens TaxID=294 RepID=UPI003F98B400
MNAVLKEMFDKVDRMSADGFVGYLADDVTFRFGNAPELIGKDNVRAGIEVFFTHIAGLKHVLLDEWSERNTTILRFDTHYTKLDLSLVVIPCCATLRFTASGMIDDYRIYADITPLYADSYTTEVRRASA